MGNAADKRPADRYLAIYVNDHRAGAAAGLALAKRALKENVGTALGDALSVVVSAIEQDKAQLERVAQALGVRSDPLKLGIARVGELVARAKPNGQIRGYSPLSRLLELESLLAVIDAKRTLWLALQAADRPELRTIDFDSLIQRADEQRKLLEPHHRTAAKLAFVDEQRETGEPDTDDVVVATGTAQTSQTAPTPSASTQTASTTPAAPTTPSTSTDAPTSSSS